MSPPYAPAPIRLTRPPRQQPRDRPTGALAVIARATGQLWALQLVAGVLAQVAFDARPLALAVTAAYLALAVTAARGLARASGPGCARRVALGLCAAVLWQLPALLGSVNMLREELGQTAYDGNSDLLDFAMQTWQTALMPALALLPGHVTSASYGEVIAYYAGLVASGPALVLGFAAAACPPARSRPPVPAQPLSPR